MYSKYQMWYIISVYHLVIDAVELYNETWEEEYIKSVQSDEKQDETSSTSSATIGSGHILEVEGSLHSSVSAAEERQSTKTKRLNYMSAVKFYHFYMTIFTQLHLQLTFTRQRLKYEKKRLVSNAKKLL